MNDQEGAEDLIMSDEQRASYQEALNRHRERVAEDPATALHAIGWSNVRDLHDAYVEELNRAESAQSEVAQLKAELQKMVPYEDFAALEATSDAAEENLRRLKRLAINCFDPFNDDGLAQDEALVVLEGYLRGEMPTDDMPASSISAHAKSVLAAALSEAPATEGSE